MRAELLAMSEKLSRFEARLDRPKLAALLTQSEAAAAAEIKETDVGGLVATGQWATVEVLTGGCLERLVPAGEVFRLIDSRD